jgi:2-methylcitrate dehydratase PrpD
MSDAILDLINFAIDCRFESLPSGAITWAKKAILDTIAVSIAGSSAAGCREVVDLVKEWGGREESTIWIFGGKVPVNLASLANGPMARARDYGDVHERVGHVTEYTLPPTLTMAERQGGVTGKDLITAIVVGGEIITRIGITLKKMPGESPRYCMFRIFGPTAAVSKILNLDRDTFWNAMGLSFSQAAGDMQMYKDGALSVRIQHGFVADAAIKSCLLAQRGITGTKNILQGEWGFYNAFEPEYELAPLTDELGQRFEVTNTSLKPYAACKFAHSAINATIDCVKEHDIRAEEIAEIDVGVNNPAYNFVCLPRKVKDNPKNPVDCQFSIPYCVATAAIKGRASMDDFGEEVIWQKDVRELLSMVKTRVDNEITMFDDRTCGGAKVKIRTKNGHEFTKTVYYVLGHPKNPMDMNQLTEKFRECMAYSAIPFKEKNIERLIDMLMNLEDVSNTNEIVNLLTP